MKSFKQYIQETTETVKNWQAGVRSSQLAGSPDPKRMGDPNFQAGWKAGLKHGLKALDPSYRANRVRRQAAAIEKNRPVTEEVKKKLMKN